MSTIYHVSRTLRAGQPILPLAVIAETNPKMAARKALRWLAANYGGLRSLLSLGAVRVEDMVERFIAGDGQQVHFHATREEAEAFAAEFGGTIYAVDASGLDVQVGAEYPHPVIAQVVPAERVTRV